jgi:hypothetical protein
MALTPATWYLGPLGDLRPLMAPSVNIVNTQERFGGVHQALSGARVMDTVGFRATYDMTWNYMSEDDYAWLNALYLRQMGRQLRMINPMKKNLMSHQATTLTSAFARQLGVSIAGILQRQWSFDYPTDPNAGIGNRSMLITTNTDVATLGVVRFDADMWNPRPVGETITASVWMKAAAPINVTAVIDYADAGLVPNGNSGNVVMAVTTSWQRFSITVTPGSTVTAARLALLFSPGALNVKFAAPQMELAASATPFTLGGGGPAVLLDQMTSSSPRFPLSDISLSILEA